MTDLATPDPFVEILRAEGLDDDAIVRVYRALREANLSVMVPPWMASRAEAAARRASAATAREREMAVAVPYTGTIRQCQAEVYKGRLGFAGCSARARFVVRRPERPGSSHLDAGWLDGRIAVCRRHAGDPESRRHLNAGWQESVLGPGSIEPVESQYDPQYTDKGR